MKIEILQCDIPNKNGRSYSTEMIKNQLEEINQNNKQILGYYNNNTGNLVDVAFIAKDLKVDENGFLISNTVQILETPMGILLKKDLAQGFNIKFNISGKGDIDKHGNVSNYTLDSITGIASPEFEI